MKNKKLLGFGAIIVLIIAMVFAFNAFKQKPVEGAKAITIEVVDDQKKSTTYELKTDAEYLRGAMDEADGLTYEGDESEYGLMVHTVNGVKADFNVDGSYWSFYVNDEYCMNGIDTQVVNDQDHFKIEYAK